MKSTFKYLSSVLYETHLNISLASSMKSTFKYLSSFLYENQL